MNLTNNERFKASKTPSCLRALKLSSCAQRAAQKQADAQAAADKMFHNADLTGVMTSCGASAVGENVAYGFSSDAAVMAGWMNSSGHRANILSTKYTSVAVAWAVGSNGQRYWAQVFLG
ncbi:CAP domain-containing protein [Nocardioides sp. AE5]|uniref:CAP domain-containing protein n=1 Tax=Nocardioides sp. AE5 TaxID=2962573 RepID=UPI002881E447|nr:CAP domain-containing protein [Nocardioides sp. AE5]MDT0200409.1 CAP domain-containing protein [Nocardioides sp. AE5]